ncbi:hypothetical protein HY484_00640 [Candidatus Woesearchaeota archaeon]|nr:hypothetical protein [Candidatus Woesearchaeota archaeon]
MGVEEKTNKELEEFKRSIAELHDEMVKGDSGIAFDENSNLRPVAEIERMKFQRMLAKNPEYLAWFRKKEELLREKEDTVKQAYAPVLEPAYLG